MPDVGVLQLQIRDDSKEAYSNLDKLADALSRVKKAVEGSKYGSVATQISKLAKASQAIAQSGAAQQINKLAFALERLKKVQDVKLPNLGGLKKMRDQISGSMDFGGNFATAGVESATETFRELEHEAQRATEEVEKFKNALSATASMKWDFGTDQFEKFSDILRRWLDMRSAMAMGAGNTAGYLEAGMGAEVSTDAEKGWSAWKDGAIEVEGTVSDAMESTRASIGGVTQALLEAGQAQQRFGQDNEGVFERSAAWGEHLRNKYKQIGNTLEERLNNPKSVVGMRLRGEMGIEQQKAAIEEWAHSTKQSVEEVRAAISSIMASAQGASGPMQQFVNTTREAQESSSAQRTYGTELVDNLTNNYSKLDLMTMKMNGMKQALADDINMNKADSQQIAERTMRIQELSDKIDKLKRDTEDTTKETRNLKDELKGRLKSTWLGKLEQQFARLVKYRILRNIIKQISEGFSEGVENVYRYSQAIGSDFAPSMDSAASSLLQMKNAVGAAAAPLIQSLIPVMQTLVNWFITGINYLNQFISLLRGQSTWTRAVPTTTKAFDDVEKSASGASAAMKDLLADWDELNIIQSDTSGTGSGVGTSAMTDYMNMFEEVSTFDSRIKSLVNYLKDNFDDILTLVGLISAGLLGLKLSSAFEGFLGQIGSLIAGGAMIAIGFTLSYSGAFGLGSEGYNTTDLLKMIGGNIATMLGTGVVFETLGLGGAAGTITGLAIALTVDLVGYINGIADANDKARWGETSLTPDEVKSYVESQFKFDIQAEIENLSAVITNQESARQNLNTAITNFGNSLKKIKIMVDGTPKGIQDAKEQALEVIKAINTSLSTSEESLTVLTRIVPITSENGEDRTEDFLGNLELADQKLSDYFNGLGQEIARWIDEGEKTGWANNEAQMALELMKHQQNIVDTAKQNKMVRDFRIDSELNLAGMTRETAGEVFTQQEKLIDEYTEKIRTAYENQVKELFYYADLADAAGLKDDNGGPLGDIYRASAETLLEQIKNGDIYNQINPAIQEMRNQWVEGLKEVYGDVGVTGAMGVKGWWESIFGGNSKFEQELKKQYNQGGIEGAASYLQSYIDTMFDGIDKTGIIKKASEQFGFNIFDILSPANQSYVVDRIVDAFGGNTEIASKVLQSLGLNGEALIDELTNYNNLQMSDEIPAIVDETEKKIIDMVSGAALDTTPGFTKSIQEGADTSVRAVDDMTTRIKNDFASLNGLTLTANYLTGSGLGGLFSGMGGGRLLQLVTSFNAAGGIIKSGDVFSANENGDAEYIGRYGSNTAVVNNGQIIEGITAGVAGGQEEQNALLRRQNEILIQLLNKEFTAKVTASSGLGRVTNQSGAMYSKISGV